MSRIERNNLEIASALHQLSMEINGLLYEAFQISIWLFLATVGCASLGDPDYRNLAFMVTGFFLLFQMVMFLKYRIATRDRKRFLADLEYHAIPPQCDRLSVKHTSSSKNHSSDYSAIYFFLPFIVSGAFYVYSFGKA